MTFGDTLKSLFGRLAKNMIIVSPRFTDYTVQEVLPTADIGIDEQLRTEVVRIIQEEIKIQMTEVGESGSDAIPAGTNAESKIKSNLLKGATAAKNPIGAVTSALQGIPLPHAQLVALALAMIPILFKEFTRDGGILDLRWKRIMDNEVNSFLDRQTQRNTQIGLRQVIIQSRAGFIQMNGAGGNENTIRQVRDGGVDGNRLAQIDIFDHSKELFSP